MEERVRVMPETGQARVVDGHQSAAGNCAAVHRERPEPAAREVSLQYQSVVAGAKNDAVKDRVHTGSTRIRQGESAANLSRQKAVNLRMTRNRFLMTGRRIHPYGVTA